MQSPWSIRPDRDPELIEELHDTQWLCAVPRVARTFHLGFCCPAHPGESGMPEHGDYQNNPHLGDRVTRALLTLDAWT